MLIENFPRRESNTILSTMPTLYDSCLHRRCSVEADCRKYQCLHCTQTVTIARLCISKDKTRMKKEEKQMREIKVTFLIRCVANINCQVRDIFRFRNERWIT